ncbi:MAG: FtsX-like permease family protein, partial [Acidimicrobiales bacterium]
PAEISQAEEARTVIGLAVTALALAIVATITHTLFAFVRQRRRDYAVLKTLGFTRGQIRTTVLTQSGAILAIALIAALPLGIAAARWLWIAFAERIGVVVNPVVPSLLLGAAILLSVLAVQCAALIPASLASRTPAGRTLHGE